MFVKTMVLEGFKSYGQRVQIDGFDPAFNAITGLNGSGKSNILDGICFLMGITNLSCVRAENLQVRICFAESFGYKILAFNDYSRLLCTRTGRPA